MALIVFAGYAMARFRFRGKAWLVALFLLAQVLPHVVLLLPFFTMFQVAGLINTRLALVVAYTVITLPFSVLTMRGFFAAIPVELDEAAMVDGAKSIKIHGDYVPVRADVKNLEMLSAHADADEILRWLQGFKTPPRKAFITHGEASASDALRHRIEEELGWTCVVPDHGQQVELP